MKNCLVPGSMVELLSSVKLCTLVKSVLPTGKKRCKQSYFECRYMVACVFYYDIVIYLFLLSIGILCAEFLDVVYVYKILIYFFDVSLKI